MAITSLGGGGANLSAFCSFVRFALVWFCLFPLPLGVWEGLRFVMWHSLDLSLTCFGSAPNNGTSSGTWNLTPVSVKLCT